MVVRCYTTSNDKKDVNKELTLVKEVNLEVKGGNNIMDAVIVITNPADVTFNYVQIVDPPYNGRYYFVLPFNTESNGIVRLNLHEDVLMSLKSQYLNETAVIDRQENEGNLYLVDGEYPTENRNKIFFKEFPNGFDAGLSYYLTIGG